MNAIDLLISEHNKVRSILELISGDTKNFAEKKKVFQTLRHDLLRHEKMEQNVWYPKFKGNANLGEEVKHLIKEEQEAHQEIQDLNEINNEDDWYMQFKKFKQDVEHHANEEETLLFPRVRHILSEDELIHIGKEMLAFEKEYDN